MNTWKKIRTENRKKWKHNEQTGFLHVSISDEKMKACLTQAPQTQTSRRVRRRPVVAAICTLGLVLAMVCTPLGSYATQFLFQPVSTQKPTEQIHPHYGFQQEAPLTCLSEKTLDGVITRVYQYRDFHVRLTEDHNQMDASAQIQDKTDGTFFTAELCGTQAQCYQDADGAIAFISDVSLPCTLRIAVSGAIAREDFLFLLSQIQRL